MGRCYRFLRARFASLVGRETFSVNWSCIAEFMILWLATASPPAFTLGTFTTSNLELLSP